MIDRSYITSFYIVNDAKFYPSSVSSIGSVGTVGSVGDVSTGDTSNLSPALV